MNTNIKYWMLILLVIFLFPFQVDAQKNEEKTRQKCVENLKHFASFLEHHSHVRASVDPVYPPILLNIYLYFKKEETFRCSLDKNPVPVKGFPILKTSYLRYDSFVLLRGSNMPRAEVPLYFDKKGNHPKGRFVLFANKKVRWLNEENFTTLLKKMEKEINRRVKTGAVNPEKPEIKLSLWNVKDEAEIKADRVHVLTKGVKLSKVRKKCINHLYNFYKFAQFYKKESGEDQDYPPQFFDIYDLSKDENLLQCGLDRNPSSLPEAPILKTSYLRFDRYYLARKARVGKRDIPLYFDKAATYQNGRYVLFANGKLGWMDEGDFLEHLKNVEEKITKNQNKKKTN